MLHRRGARLVAYGFEHGIALVAFRFGDADLDEFMGAQVAFDLGYHGFAEAIAAYNHDRVQPMRSGAQCAPLLRGQFVHRAS